MNNTWPTVKLGDILQRHKDSLLIQPLESYKRLTIRMNGRGIVLRDVAIGDEIGTKKQFTTRAGQLVLSKIDARNGAFGILPSECDGAIITGNFWAFDPDENRLDVRYLNYLTKTPLFVDFCIRASEGTTNRRYLQEPKFLAQQISLPPLNEQRRIIARIEELSGKIEQVRSHRSENQLDCNHLLKAAYWRIAANAPRRPMKEIAPLRRRPVIVSATDEYQQVAVRSFGKGTFHKPPLIGSEVTWQKPYLVKEDDILISNIKAWEGAIAVAKHEDDCRVGSHRYLTCTAVPNTSSPRFVCFHLLTPEGLGYVGEASPGTADRNRTLNVHALLEIPIPVPPYSEQLWFEKLYDKVEALKALQQESDLEIDALMPSILSKAFSGEL